MKENPADYLKRGITLEEILELRAWWSALYQTVRVIEHRYSIQVMTQQN